MTDMMIISVFYDNVLKVSMSQMAEIYFKLFGIWEILVFFECCMLNMSRAS